ncbi:MAG: twin-arginine translocase subunit TatC [Bacteroidota bacterium]
MADITEEKETSTKTKSAAAELEMPFLEHLEELRRRLIKALLGLVLAAVVCAFFADFIVTEIVLRPALGIDRPMELINIVPYGQLVFYMEAVLFSALILGMPWILYQLWKFVEPGLYSKERKYISGIVGFTSLCFFLGVSFAYFILLPFMLQFFAGFGSPDVENLIAINEYATFILTMILVSGLIFELPMVSYVLARFGILTPAFMRHYRRHAYVVILVLSALITPTTDIFTMSVFSFPIVLLYEASIGITAIAKRKRDESFEST